MAMIEEIKNPVSILLKSPFRNIVILHLNHMFFSLRQAKNNKTNCPAHRPSKPPPFPRTFATPFFKILASPSDDETIEL